MGPQDSGNPAAAEQPAALHPASGSPKPGQSCERPLSSSIELNQAHLEGAFRNCSDVVFRPFSAFGAQRSLLVYVDGLVDSEQMEQGVLQPLTSPESPYWRDSAVEISFLQENVLSATDVELVRTLPRAVDAILRCQVLLLVDGDNAGLAVSLGKWSQRSVEEPDTEAVIRGPKEGFTENVRTSTALIRRRIHTPDLKMENMQIGTYTKTQVILCYIQGLAQDSIVSEMRTRLQRIEIDSILESGYIEELIEDVSWSPFPQLQDTEKPDVVAALLLEGRIAILIDGTPFALTAPINLWGALSSPEDYYERFIIATLIRWLRYIFTGMALLLPSLYVAVTTFHQEFLPFPLLLSIAAARENTPLPAVVEALLMEITFEALREAGVRLPKAIGSAISIVGALVIGQAAVQAGIVSAPMVIIVAITGIASFTIPRYNFAIAIRMLRFPMIILAGLFGLFGIVFGVLCITLHICGLRSFGVPYTSPMTPLSIKNLGDTLVRAPWWAMSYRPAQQAKANMRRQSGRMSSSSRTRGNTPQNQGAR